MRLLRSSRLGNARAALVAAAMLLASPEAIAQGDKAAAESLFQAGVALMSHPTNTHHSRSEDGRARDARIARPAGLVVSAVIAAGVFIAGQQLFPLRRPAPAPVSVAPPAPSPVTPPVEPTPPPTPAPQPPVVDANAADVAVAAKTEDAAPAEKAARAKESETEPEESAATTAAGKALQQDKDLAREAWRRNRPDVTSAANKTSVLIPIKGSSKGSSSKVLRKTRTVVVTLPKAVAMITMRVYNLKHPVFHRVWIDQDEANAKPEDGSKLRIILGQTYDPQIEITDDFVRVSVRRVEPSSEPVNTKRREKPSEKSHNESDEPAPADEKD